jgi:hypothetical protein
LRPERFARGWPRTAVRRRMFHMCWDGTHSFVQVT